MKGNVVVPASSIKISDNDDDFYDDASDAKVSGEKIPSFKGDKVLHMTFTKRESRSLHYMI